MSPACWKCPANKWDSQYILRSICINTFSYSRVQNILLYNVKREKRWSADLSVEPTVAHFFFLSRSRGAQTTFADGRHTCPPAGLESATSSSWQRASIARDLGSRVLKCISCACSHNYHTPSPPCWTPRETQFSLLSLSLLLHFLLFFSSFEYFLFISLLIAFEVFLFCCKTPFRDYTPRAWLFLYDSCAIFHGATGRVLYMYGESTASTSTTAPPPPSPPIPTLR